MKRIVAIALVMLIGVSIIGCGKDKRTDAEKFVGTWEMDTDDEPDSWHDTIVVFSDGTAYATSYCNSDPDVKYDAVYNSWTMENGYFKYNLSAFGTVEDYMDEYQFIDSDHIVFGVDNSDKDKWSYYTKIK